MRYFQVFAILAILLGYVVGAPSIVTPKATGSTIAASFPISELSEASTHPNTTLAGPALRGQAARQELPHRPPSLPHSQLRRMHYVPH